MDRKEKHPLFIKNEKKISDPLRGLRINFMKNRNDAI